MRYLLWSGGTILAGKTFPWEVLLNKRARALLIFLTSAASTAGFGRDMEGSSSFSQATSTGFCHKDKEEILIKAHFSFKQLKKKTNTNDLYKEVSVIWVCSLREHIQNLMTTFHWINQSTYTNITAESHLKANFHGYKKQKLTN